MISRLKPIFLTFVVLGFSLPCFDRCQAATLLEGLGDTNAAVPADHGSNLPGTPSLTLTWQGNWDQWAGWDGRGDVYQIENSSVAPPHQIVLAPSPGVAASVTSFELDEWIGGGDTVVEWSISGPTSGLLASGTWDDFSAGKDAADSGGRTLISPMVTGADGEALTISFAQTSGKRNYLALDNLSFDGVTPGPDTLPPFVVGISPQQAGGLLYAGETILYTVTFNEALDPSSVGPEDFINAGSSGSPIATAVPTVDPASFEISLVAGIGTVQLGLSENASLLDLSGNALISSPAFLDDLVLEVIPAPAPPQLTIEQAGIFLDLFWQRRADHTYDLLSSTDLSTPHAEWAVFTDGETVYQDLLTRETTMHVGEIPASDTQRFFLLRENDVSDRMLRVLSFNIWTADSNFPKINEVVQMSGADVIGFQELGNVSAVVQSLENTTGLDWYSQGMIVSRFPIIDSSGGGALIEISPGRTAWIFNIHFPAYPYQPYDLRDGTLPLDAAAVIAASESARGSQTDALVAAITNSGALTADTPIFVTGDFNEPSHLDWTQAAADATDRPYDLAIEYPASKKMENLGLHDAFRSVWPDEVGRRGYTWTPGYPPPNISANEVHDRIDFVYFGGSGVRVIDSLNIGFDTSNPNTDLAIENFPADHRAVLATFLLPE